jgi:hypothetical protein
VACTPREPPTTSCGLDHRPAPARATGHRGTSQKAPAVPGPIFMMPATSRIQIAGARTLKPIHLRGADHRSVALHHRTTRPQDGPPEAQPSPPDAFRGAACLSVQPGPDESLWTSNGFWSRFRFSNRSASRKVRCGLSSEPLAQSRYAHGVPAATTGCFDFAPIEFCRDGSMGHRS